MLTERRLQKRTSKTLVVSINKRQHRFLVGQNADEILEAFGCSVELPQIEDPSENVTIRGPQASLPKALGLVRPPQTLVQSLLLTL